MKKLFTIFIIALFAMTNTSWAAVNVKSAGVKKAAPVATKKADAMESATSLLPTVIGIVSSVQSLNAQQQQLSADCAPTSDEINTVNELVKEWAKLGNTTAASAVSGLGEKRQGSYGTCVDFDEVCYEAFESEDSDKPVWEGFPKVSSAQKCDDGNSKNCKTVSNIYDIFGRIPFGDADYTKSEAKKVAALKEKSQRCAPAKIAAAKRELYGGFLTQTLGSVGQSTGAAGTSSVLQAVSSMGGSGDVKSMLPSLGQMATQMLDK